MNDVCELVISIGLYRQIFIALRPLKYATYIIYMYQSSSFVYCMMCIDICHEFVSVNTIDNLNVL